MNRLQSELERLYLCGPAGAADAQGRVRALVLALSGPADWAALQRVWLGVQVELELPAPAIAVSGGEALQLWFSLAQPVDVHAAHAFLDALRLRWLAELPPRRVRLLPDAARPAPPLPPREIAADQWSAFVSPDLAAMFAETPWLDIAPGEDGQANLLRALQPIAPAAFTAAREQLAAGPAHEPAPARDAQAPVPAHAPAAAREAADPAVFLARVMNDEAAPLALRIEPAKALLPYSGAASPQPGTR